MSDLYWLTDEQMAKLAPFFPKSHGKPRVDDKRVLSGIKLAIRPQGVWATQDALQPLEALERERHFRQNDDRAGRRARREKDRDDRRDLSESAPHRDQLGRYIGARALLSSLPKVDWLLGDRGYDADWFREALQDQGIRACIPARKQRKTPVKYDKRRYKQRNRIEIMFGRLKDWRRVATRYDRCPKVFLSAIALAATVIYWL